MNTEDTMTGMQSGGPSADWNEYLAELGKRIRQYRADRDMTQKELGALVGTSGPYIYQVETGKQNITLELMWRIARAFGLNLELLLAEGEIWEEPTEKSVQQLNGAMDKATQELAQLARREQELLATLQSLKTSAEVLTGKFGGKKGKRPKDGITSNR